MNPEAYEACLTAHDEALANDEDYMKSRNALIQAITQDAEMVPYIRESNAAYKRLDAARKRYDDFDRSSVDWGRESSTLAALLVSHDFHDAKFAFQRAKRDMYAQAFERNPDLEQALDERETVVFNATPQCAAFAR